MPSPIRILISGEFACFTRPEMKVERVSYDVITPSAARGILEAIYWKPQVRYVIERLHILKPIRFTQIRRNEVDTKIPTKGKSGVGTAMKTGTGALNLVIEDHRQQRASTLLRDVCYAIEARFQLLDDTEPIEKHFNMIKRRAENGQCFHRPYLGCREFPAHFEWIDDEIPKTEIAVRDADHDFGYMLHDFIFTPQPPKSKKYDLIESNQGMKLNAEPRFFRAQMKQGIITVPPLEGEGVVQ